MQFTLFDKHLQINFKVIFVAILQAQFQCRLKRMVPSCLQARTHCIVHLRVWKHFWQFYSLGTPSSNSKLLRDIEMVLCISKPSQMDVGFFLSTFGQKTYRARSNINLQTYNTEASCESRTSPILSIIQLSILFFFLLHCELLKKLFFTVTPRITTLLVLRLNKNFFYYFEKLISNVRMFEAL